MTARLQLAEFKKEQGFEYSSDDDVDLHYASAALEALTLTNSEVDTGLNDGFESTLDDDDTSTAQALARNLNTLKYKVLDFHVGEWVEISGLTSERGMQLNGLIGEITTVGERIGVYLEAEGQSVSFPRANLSHA